MRCNFSFPRLVIARRITSMRSREKSGSAPSGRFNEASGVSPAAGKRAVRVRLSIIKSRARWLVVTKRIPVSMHASTRGDGSSIKHSSVPDCSQVFPPRIRSRFPKPWVIFPPLARLVYSSAIWQAGASHRRDVAWRNSEAFGQQLP